MKLDAITIAALAVSGLAVYAFTRGRSGSPATSTDVAFAMAQQQRREVGAAVPLNTDYLRNWGELSGTFATQPDFWV